MIMNFTHAQILDLTGMTQERLRHWRREIPGLDARAARGGIVSFEEVALLTVLSRATDELGLPLVLIASHYDDLLIAFQEERSVGDPDVVLWLSTDLALVRRISSPPDVPIAAMVRLAPIIEQIYREVHRPGGRRQLVLSFGNG